MIKMHQHIYNKAYLLICFCLLMPTCLTFYFKKGWIGPLYYSNMMVCGEKYIIYSNETNENTEICLDSYCISIPELVQGYRFACSQYYDDEYNYVGIKINATLVKIWKIQEQQGLIPIYFQLNASSTNGTIRQISIYKNMLAVSYNILGSTSFTDVYIIQQPTQSHKIKTISFPIANCSAHFNYRFNLIVLCEGSSNDTLYVYYGADYAKYLNTSFYACSQNSYSKRDVQRPNPTFKQQQNNIESKIYIIYQTGRVLCNYEINIKHNIEDDVRMLQFINETNEENQYGWRYYCNGRKFYHPYVDSSYINQKYDYNLFPDVFSAFLQPIRDATCTPMYGSPWTTNNVVFYLHSQSFLDPNQRYIDVYQEYSLIPVFILIAFGLLIIFLVRSKFTYKKILNLLFVSFHQQQIEDFLDRLEYEQ